MNQEEAILSAITADPDEDMHRVVYADWLEEHDNPERAEFIRGQIALSRTIAGAPGRDALAYRVRQLLDDHEEEWLGPLAGVAEEWTFRRGLVERVAVKAEELWRRGNPFRLVPIQRLQVMYARGDVSRLVALRRFARLISLDLTCNDLDDDDVTLLAEARHLPELKRLRLSLNHLGNKCADLLVQHPFFARLEKLECGGNPFGPQVRQALGECFGNRVSFACERDEDHLYAIQDDYFRAGFSSDHRQILAWGQSVLFFDHEGNLLQVERRKNNDELTALEQEQRWTSATIKIKRFQSEEGSIIDFNWWQDVFDNPAEHAEEGEQLREAMLGWVWDGQFEFRFDRGNNSWFDKYGEVTDT